MIRDTYPNTRQVMALKVCDLMALPPRQRQSVYARWCCIRRSPLGDWMETSNAKGVIGMMQRHCPGWKPATFVYEVSPRRAARAQNESTEG